MKHNRTAKWLYPEDNAANRVASQMITVLAQLSFVRGISLFGSLADDRADRWSDIDIRVACQDVENTKWAAAAAVRAVKPILFYRMFGSAEQPTGRYWFDDESPFQRIDISFESPEEYASCERFDGNITLREVYSVEQAVLPDAKIQPLDLAITEQEKDIGWRIYLGLSALKHHMRKLELIERSAPEVVKLQEALVDLPREATLAGGHVGELGYRVLDMIGHVLEGSEKQPKK